MKSFFFFFRIYTNLPLRNKTQLPVIGKQAINELLIYLPIYPMFHGLGINF